MMIMRVRFENKYEIIFGGGGAVELDIYDLYYSVCLCTLVGL